MIQKALIIKSATPPNNTSVIWLDLSEVPARLRTYVNGDWVDLNSESVDISELRVELMEEIGKTNKNVTDLNTALGVTDGNVSELSTTVGGHTLDISGLNSTTSSQGQRITAIELTEGSIMEAANTLLNELIDGKKLIANALTDRGYPTNYTDSSASMAQKIENMSYDAGWLAQIGYTEENGTDIKNECIRVKALLDDIKAGVLTDFRNTDIKIAPFLPTDRTSYNYMFDGCDKLTYIPKITAPQAESFSAAFRGTNVVKIEMENGDDCSGWWATFMSCPKLKRINWLNWKAFKTNAQTFEDTTGIEFMLIKYMGTTREFNLPSNNRIQDLNRWGIDTNENRQSLVDTLLTYSYDRATAGYSAATIKLHANTLARLTAEEIAAITAKGFTLTS